MHFPPSQTPLPPHLFGQQDSGLGPFAGQVSLGQIFTAQLLPVYPASHLQERSFMQRPWKLHISGHFGVAQSTPANISVHAQVPSSSLHTPFSVFLLQLSLQVFPWHPAPANFWPWKAGEASTRLQTHVLLMHTPLPLQLFGQYFSEQSRPRKPASHLHFPSLMQRPWKPHSLSQAVTPQFGPVKPSWHSQLPSTQVPWAEHSSGQDLVAQSSPVHIWPSKAATDFRTGWHLHLPLLTSHSPCST